MNIATVGLDLAKNVLQAQTRRCTSVFRHALQCAVTGTGAREVGDMRMPRVGATNNVVVRHELGLIGDVDSPTVPVQERVVNGRPQRTAPRRNRNPWRAPNFSMAKHLNNLIEQDHRNIKSRTQVMLGFKRFRNAAIMIAGIELMHCIRKGQFCLAGLLLKEATAPAVWNAALSTQ
ncbi:hypothetical protein LMG29542_08131 [Paraburkholderia humisilvae]|uniref:DDE domain-containing protein n=1 Tax=Paraburkholderia humisilvae TaxID=627669 RepID=A0A6J5F8Q6_9BURK|nr:hypothetical protein LMG29542_08131 [Paraburkholderia humisilvae]